MTTLNCPFLFIGMRGEEAESNTNFLGKGGEGMKFYTPICFNGFYFS